MNLLITGGAGFVGSNLAIEFAKDNEVTVLDNLKRRGSELNIPRLKEVGIKFVHGDIRNKEDFEGAPDLIIECSAEPSVMAGVWNSPGYLINTNLLGAINCFEYARICDADIVFLSTSRVYPVETTNSICFTETEMRFNIKNQFSLNPHGTSANGISEYFPLNGTRTLYGATKLASELILQEYIETYGMKGVINRCGVLAGPWQMGKVDQGFVTYWVAKHYYQQSLNYIGFGGHGKQVRDVLHVKDLYRLLDIQINDMVSHNGEIYNIGGGMDNSISLLELTGLCRQYTGYKTTINNVEDTRPGDIRIYITDNSKVTARTGWKPKITINQIVEEIATWIRNNEEMLRPVLA